MEPRSWRSRAQEWQHPQSISTRSPACAFSQAAARSMFFRSACQYQRTLAMIIEYHFLSGAFSQVSLRARLDRRASGAFHGVSSELGGDMRRCGQPPGPPAPSRPGQLAAPPAALLEPQTSLTARCRRLGLHGTKTKPKCTPPAASEPRLCPAKTSGEQATPRTFSHARRSSD